MKCSRWTERRGETSEFVKTCEDKTQSAFVVRDPRTGKWCAMMVYDLPAGAVLGHKSCGYKSARGAKKRADELFAAWKRAGRGA
jgi:hypothetical protein